MTLSTLFTRVSKTLKSNSPEILTALAVSGVVTTAYLAGKASFQAAGHLESQDPHMSNKDRARLVWKLYIPAGLTGAATIACVIGATKVQGKRTAAAVTAYSITERAFSEYKEKVVEQIGKGKEQKIRDEIAQDTVTKTSGNKEVVIFGSGQVLCCELYTHRYFRSDMESLRKAQNEVNALLVESGYVPLFEFYERIGLPYTSASGELGWEIKLMDLRFSSCLSENGEPCLAFEYNYVKPIK
jgi:hypothetical protein